MENGVGHRIVSYVWEQGQIHSHKSLLVGQKAKALPCTDWRMDTPSYRVAFSRLLEPCMPMWGEVRIRSDWECRKVLEWNVYGALRMDGDGDWWKIMGDLHGRWRGWQPLEESFKELQSLSLRAATDIEMALFYSVLMLSTLFCNKVIVPFNTELNLWCDQKSHLHIAVLEKISKFYDVHKTFTIKSESIMAA